MAETGRLRRQAAVWLAHPALVAKASPAVSALASDACVRLYDPLSTMARSKSPLACGDATCDSVDRPPADSPKMVTWFGLPPKPAMLRCTQRRAACWSSRP